MGHISLIIRVASPLKRYSSWDDIVHNLLAGITCIFSAEDPERVFLAALLEPVFAV
jgi:hypothetical protein